MENFLLECSFCNLRYLLVHVQMLLLTLFSAPQLLHRHEGFDCSKTVPGDGVDTQSQGFRMNLCAFTCHYTKTDKSQTETKMQRLESSKSSKTMVKVILTYDRYLSKEVSTRGGMHRTFPLPLKERVCFLVGAGENLVLQSLGGTQPWFTNAGTCNVTPGYPHMPVLLFRVESFHAKELWWYSTLRWKG